MRHPLVIALVCSAALAWPATAQAAGGGGGGGGPQETSAKDTDPDYAAGMAAISRKDWKQAADRMGAYVKRKPDDADGWNEFGHASRRLGQLQVALDAYDKALKINPRHRGAREYLGEAYLQMDDVARAEQELKALDRLCFFGCEEYNDLKRSIDEYRKRKQGS
jgi:cytochrome c-type biogenesis protein CcmH/NrfG